MISSLCCNFENFRTDPKIIEEVELKNWNYFEKLNLATKTKLFRNEIKTRTEIM